MKICILASEHGVIDELTDHLKQRGHAVQQWIGKRFSGVPGILARVPVCRANVVLVDSLDPWTMLAGLVAAQMLHVPAVHRVEETMACDPRLETFVVRHTAAIAASTRAVEQQVCQMGAAQNDVFVVPNLDLAAQPEYTVSDMAGRLEAVCNYARAKGAVATQLSVGEINGSFET